jgi:hypothetical protein
MHIFQGVDDMQKSHIPFSTVYFMKYFLLQTKTCHNSSQEDESDKLGNDVDILPASEMHCHVTIGGRKCLNLICNI